MAVTPFRGFQLLAFQHFSFCQSVALGGFAGLFKVRSSRFKVQSLVLSISIPNTSPLPHLPRGGLEAPWTYPGTIDHPHSPIFKQASLSKSKSASSASGSIPPHAASSSPVSTIPSARATVSSATQRSSPRPLTLENAIESTQSHSAAKPQPKWRNIGRWDMSLGDEPTNFSQCHRRSAGLS